MPTVSNKPILSSLKCLKSTCWNINGRVTALEETGFQKHSKGPNK